MKTLKERKGLCLQERRFPLGGTFITRNALDRLNLADVQTSLQRHARGDWGECWPADVQLNDEALRDGCRLLSAYQDRNGVKFWIITEADRSTTTILLPVDY